MPPTAPLIWVLIDDRPGNATQAMGVAEALIVLRAGAIVEKRVAYTSLAKLPNILRGASLVGLTSESEAALIATPTAPWPDVVIAAGRRAAPVSRWIKKTAAHAGKKTIIAHVMNPGVAGAADFDLIAIPNHDCQRDGGDAPNVMRITGAPHRFSSRRLAAERDAWAEKLGGIPRPFIALLVGGATRQRGFAPDLAADLGARVAAMAREVRGSVLLSTSRRTGPEAESALLAAIPEPRSVFAWGQQGQTGAANPYAGFLALADVVVVTGDSVSMCAEACATPGPVYIYAPPGFVAPKHARLHAELYAKGLARPLADMTSGAPFEDWTHDILNVSELVAARIAGLLKGE